MYSKLSSDYWKITILTSQNNLMYVIIVSFIFILTNAN